MLQAEWNQMADDVLAPEARRFLNEWIATAESLRDQALQKEEAEIQSRESDPEKVAKQLAKLETRLAKVVPFPMERSQIVGLRQVAVNPPSHWNDHQPSLVASFANHQKEKFTRSLRKEQDEYEKRRPGKSFKEVILKSQDYYRQQFWERVRKLTDLQDNPPGELIQLAVVRNYLPAEYRDEAMKELSRKQQRLRKAERDRWFGEQWIPHTIPMFFEYFAVEYLFEAAKGK